MKRGVTWGLYKSGELHGTYDFKDQAEHWRDVHQQVCTFADQWQVWPAFVVPMTNEEIAQMEKDARSLKEAAKEAVW